MAFVALAIGGAAALGTGASIYGGMQGASGAKGAAAAQQDALSQAQRTTISGQQDALNYLDPFRQYGLNAGQTLQDMMFSPGQRGAQMDAQRVQLQGEVDRLKALAPKWDSYQILTGKNASERRASMFTQESQIAQQKIAEAQAKLDTFEKQSAIMKQQGNQPGAQIEESPWYKFQADLLGRSQDRAMAARGLTGSGFEAEERRRGLIELGAGETERQFGRLKGLYDVGANASAQGAGILTGAAQQIAGLQSQQGQAQAQGILGVAGANAGMATGVANSITGAMGTGLNYMQMQNLINANKPKSAPTGGLASYESGTNFVPQTGLAKLHQGEMVIPREEAEALRAQGFGLREDGTEKGLGYFGLLRSMDPKAKPGTFSTEISYDTEIDGQKLFYPILAPTLSKKEVQHIMSGKQPTDAMHQKAIDHALMRIKSGLSPFAGEGEQVPLR